MLPLNWLITDLKIQIQRVRRSSGGRRSPSGRRARRRPSFRAERLEERTLLAAVLSPVVNINAPVTSTGGDVAILEVPVSRVTSQGVSIDLLAHERGRYTAANRNAVDGPAVFAAATDFTFPAEIVQASGPVARIHGGWMPHSVESVSGTQNALGSIRGKAFHDVDEDGEHDLGEPGLDGWRIELYDKRGVLVSARVTMSTDLNGDGRIDADSEQGLYTFSGLAPGDYRVVEAYKERFRQTYPRSTGEPHFWASTSLGASGRPSSVISADLNGDAAPDLVAAGGNGVAVLLNSGNGTFATAVHYPLRDMPSSVTFADLDGDGDVDLAVATGPHVVVLWNQGGGTFGTGGGFATVNTSTSVTTADLNGDGVADLAATNWESSSVSVALNDGTGTFSAPVSFSTGYRPISVTPADLDDDGDVDLAVANQGTDDVAVLLNHGDGRFSAAVRYAAGDTPTSVTSADLDGDGDPDLAVSNLASDDVSVLLNHGNGTFASKVSLATEDGAWAVTSADLDGDGDRDLLVADAVVSVLLNDGDGSFAPSMRFTGSSSPRSVTSADVDLDGDLDLAVGEYWSGAVSVLWNRVDPGIHRVTLEGGQVAEKLDFGNVTTRHWQNPVNPFDVNDDLEVTALDALLSINAVNRYGFGATLPVRDSASTHAPFPDTDGNGKAEPIDALRVINRMNRILRHQPAILLRLANDTGAGAYDLLTGDPTIEGRVLQQSVGSSLYVGMEAMGTAERIAFNGAIDEGRFTLARQWLDLLAGGALAEGWHTVDVELRSADGAALAVHSIQFTLDDAYALLGPALKLFQ